MHLNRQALEALAERLAIAFYVLMLVAFLAAVSGSSGAGLPFLVLGALAHIGRATVEEFLGRRGQEAQLDLRLPPLRQLKRPQPTRRSPHPRPRR